MGSIVRESGGNQSIQLLPDSGTDKIERYISIKTLPDKIKYFSGEKLSIDGLVVELTYLDGSVEVIDNSKLSITPSIDEELYEDYNVITIKYNTPSGGVLETNFNINIYTKLIPFSDANILEMKHMLYAHYKGYINIADIWSVGDEKILIRGPNNYKNYCSAVIMDMNGTTSGGTDYACIIGINHLYYDWIFFNQFKFVYYNTDESLANIDTENGWYKGSDAINNINKILNNLFKPVFTPIIKPSSHVCGNLTLGKNDIVENVNFITIAEKEFFGFNTYGPDFEANACKQFEYFRDVKHKKYTYFKNNSEIDIDFIFRTPSLYSYENNTTQNNKCCYVGCHKEKISYKFINKNLYCDQIIIFCL